MRVDCALCVPAAELHGSARLCPVHAAASRSVHHGSAGGELNLRLRATRSARLATSRLTPALEAVSELSARPGDLPSRQGERWHNRVQAARIVRERGCTTELPLTSIMRVVNPTAVVIGAASGIGVQ